MKTETRVDDLVDRWEVMRNRGTPLTVEELCADCPELIAPVRRRIEILRAMDSALETEVLEPCATPEDGSRGGAGLSRGLPEVVHAAAVYRTRQHHDHGGLGVFFTAHQEELDRIVALKRIRPDKLHETARRRFLREAAITARLQHPGIVPIYGLGQDEAGPFYTMPFIQGQTLQVAIDAFHGDESLRRDPTRRGLRLRGLLQQFIAACNTVAYAHDQAIVHRDLKPSNVMLGPYGETLVLDWGLAKRTGSDEATRESQGDAPSPSPSSEDVTATGEVLGTPQYMSPEQAKGEPAGPASDIFNLGLVLCAILTGKSAFEESSFRGVDRLKPVREAAIVPPRHRDPRLPWALEAICLKALAAQPADRYSSARDLAEDVTRWLAGEPVTAWQEPVSIRVRRWMRRHRTMVATVMVGLVACVIGLGAVVGVQARANVQLRRANNQTKRALAQSEESRQQAEAVSGFLVQAFRSPDPTEDGREVKVADVLDRASARLDQGFDGSQATLGALLDALGRTYYGLGLYQRAVSRHAKARAVREAVLGPDHPDTLTSCNSLAAAYYFAGRTAEAIALAEGTVKQMEKVRGLDHPDTLRIRNGLAAAYRTVGRLPEAIALHEVTLQRMQAKLGPDHPDTLTSRNNLAVAYAEVGRTAEAIAIFAATLESREVHLGPDHPDTLRSRTSLASAYRYAGRTAEAIALHEGTLALQAAKLGPDHPDTLASRDNLANAYADAGRWSEAIALHKVTLEQYESKLGPDHPDTLISRASLAAAYEALGRWSEAEGLYRDVLVRRRKTDQPDSLLLAEDLAALGRNLLNQQRWSKAEPLLLEALSIRAQARPDAWEHYDTMSLLGDSLLGQGRYAEAQPRIVDGYEGMKARASRIPGPEQPRLRDAAERVVRLYEAWGKSDQAAAWKAKLGVPDLPADVFVPR
jgi:tetratricopeptide (TPR) repeat protein/tRNA A-37 threonylcarbamoyl transferase component Bud32